MEETVHVTILPLKSNKLNDFKQEVLKFWGVIFSDSNNIFTERIFAKEFSDELLNEIKDIEKSKSAKYLDKKFNSFSSSNWPEHQIELLYASNYYKSLVFETYIEHPTKKFKAFYCQGKWQLCDSLDEKFNEKLLL